MGLAFRVLGQPGRDNALLVTVDTGKAVSRLLFDCGDGCLNELSFGEVEGIDYLFFSHLHMDHVGGFDTFFRCTYDRTTKPNHIWGPPHTGEIMQHRFQGYMWNLVADRQASWQVHDLHADRMVTQQYELAEVFTRAHPVAESPYDRIVLTDPAFTVEALLLDHGTPSVGYVVREAPRTNIDTAKLTQMSLRRGDWLQRVRGPLADEQETVMVEGQPRGLRELQDALRVVTAGKSVAYLTDFLLDETALARLGKVLQGVTSIVCECQYRAADQELARRTYHMTTTLAATLAKQAGVGQLVLFHLSDRYQPEDWQAMLAEAKAIFPTTAFPRHWSFRTSWKT